jgi:mono/diheme cytochrome c family protein
MRTSKYTVLLVCAGCLALTAMALRSFARNERGDSAGQGQGESKQVSSPTPGGSPQAQRPTPDFSKNTWDIPADAAQTKNPVTANDESIAKGKDIFMTRKGNCVFCHGETGSGNEANFPKLRRKPADLSNGDRMPRLSDGEIYWKVTRGITGIMPTYDDPKLTAEERWHLVNFVRTLAKPRP